MDNVNSRVLPIKLFFFQAEDGIRDSSVTGVQTCALPIFGGRLVYTRFVPFNRDVGAPGPRFWFQMTRGAGTHMKVPAHVFLWLMSLEYAIIQPSVHHNLGKWFGLLLTAQALALVPKFLGL